MMLARVKKIVSQREMEEDATEGSVTTPNIHKHDWLKTVNEVQGYLRTFRCMNGAPLSYVVSEQLVPMAEANNPSNGYNTINEEMI